MRKVTNTQNQWNTLLKVTNSSGYKGVSFHKKSGKYVAQIQVNKNRIHLGLYSSALEAYIKYKEAARKYFSEYSSE